ncbi:MULTISPECIES: hypothetical protein [unclassified Ruegeria]|uniref:hypothetical protein n=1 Tax=unclassified Ruegeria TaxID=2625375 RepID=UPI001490E686|nr:MULTISPECIES: hypothetical protein [unclassified Ruegeria]NOD45697.1 hypothetical protein [Ruegeria sp. HKCCD5849]NOD51003.1 hypothetical protein [Ruegeria sp. HKCCD5851]NOD67810.1 hypothetical protein [Ruegeria sp. HKCCD7303]
MKQELRTLTIWSFLWFTAFSIAFPIGAQETEAVEVEDDELINAAVDEMIAADDLEILLVP